MLRGLKQTFLLHACLCVLAGLALYLAPRSALALVGWAPADPVLARMLGGALLALAAGSWLAAKAHSFAEVRLLVALHILLTLLGGLALIYDGLFSGAPAFVWAILVAWLPLLLAWVVAYHRSAGEGAARTSGGAGQLR